MVTLRVGAIVVAKLSTQVCDPGDRGVVYEQCSINGRPGWSVLFQGGGFDGFSRGEVDELLTVTGEICASVIDYRFTSVLQLCRDFEAGRFAAAFPAAGARAAEPV